MSKLQSARESIRSADRRRQEAMDRINKTIREDPRWTDERKKLGLDEVFDNPRR